MPSTRAIIITGATGKQGGAVLKKFATQHPKSQFTLLAVTRNKNSEAAKKIVEEFADILFVQGDLNDVPALFQSAQSTLVDAGKPKTIWGVFSVQVSMGSGVTYESEIQQGKALIDESLNQGVAHFVYSSVDRGGNEVSFETETPIPHFKTKFYIEQHLLQKAGSRGEKMGWTILRPVAFMDNLEPGMPTKVFLTALRDTLQGKPMQWISVDDIGLFATKAFNDPERWNARAEGLAGDELTFNEFSDCFQRVIGSQAPVTFSFLGSALKWAVAEVSLMITWFRTDGYRVDIDRLKKEEPQLCGFERWLKERSSWRTAATEHTET